jgi:putative membrane protein
MAEFTVAYCGPAPSPADLIGAWNLDPPLLAAMAAAGIFLMRRREGRRAGFAAWATLAVVFLSPLCALSSALFAARVAHHLLLVGVAAPLLAAAFPARDRTGPGGAFWFAAHTLALWVWHAPGPYDWALGSVAGYWLMQATLLATGVELWRAIRRAEPAPALALLVATIAQMGLLGALIVFAPHVLHAAHLASTAPWGIDPLSDQQLAGLLMWAPGISPYLAAGLAVAWRAAASTRAAT